MRLETASKQTEDDRQEDEGMEHSEQGNKEEDLQAESINVLLEIGMRHFSDFVP